MSIQVIGIVGLPGSGKTEITKALTKFDVPSIRMGDVIWGELKRRGQSITETNVGNLSNEFRKNEGMGTIAKRCVPLIESCGKGKRADFGRGTEDPADKTLCLPRCRRKGTVILRRVR